jgi:hypothetical protein
MNGRARGRGALDRESSPAGGPPGPRLPLNVPGIPPALERMGASLMVFLTKNRTLLGLVRSAYRRAKVKGDETLVVWNARIYLDDSLIVMESACPIYLDKVVEQLRIFTGSRPKPPGHFVWVVPRGNRGPRWNVARPGSRDTAGDPVQDGVT